MNKWKNSTGNRNRMKGILLLFFVLFHFQSIAGDEETPKKYVFYLHGAIIERGDPRPIHPQYGLYDYPATVSALSKYNFQLVAEQRQPDMDYVLYAQKVVGQVNDLIANGVDADDITVIGFSKGAMITVVVSSLLENDDANFVIMATCGEWFESEEFLKGLRLRGHILSIYEESDLAGSCYKLASRFPVPSSFTEVSISTGKEHGAFFLPRREWINPVISWINRKSVNNQNHGDVGAIRR